METGRTEPEFKTSLSYTLNSKLAWATWDSISEQQPQQKHRTAQDNWVPAVLGLVLHQILELVMGEGLDTKVSLGRCSDQDEVSSATELAW